MIEITTYDPQGRLLVAKVVGEISQLTTQPHGLLVLGLHDSDVDYVIDGVLTPRPENPTQVAGTTLYNIPLPSQIRIDNDSVYDATDSTMELEFPLPGTYVVDVLSFPYRDARFTFTTP